MHGSHFFLIPIPWGQFVTRVIREVRPQVVMLEINVERATDPVYLPFGVATEVRLVRVLRLRLRQAGYHTRHHLDEK